MSLSEVDGAVATVAEHQRLQPSETYHRVHRAYMLTAGLLAAWEILGITPRSTTDAPAVDASIGAGVLTDVRIGIETPDAAVFILIVLLIYFSGRFTLVWWSEPAPVRSSRAVRWDYRLAHGIAAAALIIWSMTGWLSEYRFGELLTAIGVNLIPMVVLIFSTVMVVVHLVAGGALVARAWRDRRSRSASATDHLERTSGPSPPGSL